MKTKINSIVASAILVLAALATAQEKPKVIRIGYPGVGVGGRPVVGGSVLAYVANKGLLEEEFKKDGIEVKWSYFLQAGPALNEAYANNLIDLGLLGDLPAIVGKSSGLDSRIVLGGGRNVPTAIVVPTDSRITNILELKGKRVGIFKGTNIQVSANRILALHGLTEKDLRVVNLNGVAQQAALASKDIDAIFASTTSAIQWGDQGLSKTIYSTDKDPKATNYGTNYTLIASQRFIDKYPTIVQRYVNVVLKAAAAQLEAGKREDYYKEWAKSGTPYSAWKRSYETKGGFLPEQSPLIDSELRAIYKTAAADILKYRLARKPVDVDTWIDDRFQKQALKELGLENTWKAR